MICWFCAGDGKAVGEDNYLFGHDKTFFPLNGDDMPCPACNGTGEWHPFS